jgi:hypothetical protein
VGTRPFFQWPQASSSYWLILGTSRDFDNGGGQWLINEGNITNYYYQTRSVLPPGTYYWKVKFKDQSVWSPIFEVVIPPDIYTVTDKAPYIFSWPNAAPLYWLLVTDSAGIRVVDDGALTANTYTKKKLTAGTYTWRVKYKISQDSTLGVWSPLQTFTVK